ncbi:hypothetical protein ACOME3_006412 [Neoechinorhynchus agilis]
MHGAAHATAMPGPWDTFAPPPAFGPNRPHRRKGDQDVPPAPPQKRTAGQKQNMLQPLGDSLKQIIERHETPAPESPTHVIAATTAAPPQPKPELPEEEEEDSNSGPPPGRPQSQLRRSSCARRQGRSRANDLF